MHIITKNRSGKRGQSLIEILVALGIGVILIGGVTALISVNLRTSSTAKTTDVASSLTQEVIDGVKSRAEYDWNTFYSLATTSAFHWHLQDTTIASGNEALVVGGYNFTRYFYIEQANRTQCGVGAATTSAATASCNTNFAQGETDIAEDPSTRKITAVIEWAGGGSVRQEEYVSRTKNTAIRQTDWSGGGGDTSVLTNPNDRYDTATDVDATTIPGALTVVLSGGGGGAITPNIDATDRWAWNDVIGWIDFGYAAGDVGVNNDKLFGYASSSVGFIGFDCATSPNGDICAGPAGNWKVSNVGGALQGWAYSDSIGWISFDSVTAGSPISYGVTIDAATGELRGYAWNEAIGWISMNCFNTGTCGTVNYKVKTSWSSAADSGSLTSPIFDLSNSVALNAVIWRGDSSGGGAVKFQIAGSLNPGGPWVYKGPDGTAGTNYSSAEGNSTVLRPRDFGRVRYVRYKVIIESNAARDDGPEVQDIVLTYSL